MSCEGYPTAQTAKTFNQDAVTINEVVTLEQDRTNAASDGKTKKTMWGIESDATVQRENIENLAEAQRQNIETTFTAQFTYKRIGNISAYVGDTLQEADKLNSYQYPDDSGEWYGPVQSQAFPITIPSDPASSNDWALVNALTTDSLPLYTDIVYKASGGKSAAENLALGIPKFATEGDLIEISDRGNARFKVVSGGTPDGYGILDAGGGNTAVMQHDGELKCEWFGATTTMTLTEDRSPNIQAAVNYDTENVRKLTCTSKIYLASQIDWRSGLSARFDGRIIIDENSSPNGIIFNVITTRFTGDGIYVDVCSRHLDGEDLHSYAGDITKTPTCRVLYTTDCRKFKFHGTIIGVKTKPVETGSSGYEYDFSDLHLWGPNIIDMVDYSEPDNLQSDRFTFGIYAPLFDSTLKNNNIVGYHIPAVIRGSWSVENFHPWALWSPMFCGIALFGQFNKLTGIYPDTVSSCARSQAYADANYTLTTGKNVLSAGVTTIDEANVRLGAGIYEVSIVDRPNDDPTSNVDGNTLNNWHVALADRTKLDSYGVIVGDEDITASGSNTDIGNGNLPFQSSNPASISDQRRSRVLYRGAAKFRSDRKEMSGVTKRYGITHVNSNAVDLSRATNLSQFSRYILEEFTGFYGECTITVNSTDTTLRALIPGGLFSGTDELSFCFKTNKNLDANTCYITLKAKSLQSTVTSYEVTYSYDSETTVISFERESYSQGILRGSTANRPITGLTVGLQYTDTTLQKPIYWMGAEWKDATGATV